MALERNYQMILGKKLGEIKGNFSSWKREVITFNNFPQFPLISFKNNKLTISFKYNFFQV